ncbi:MAG: ATP adenylyltransferase [Candidatus Krumholzibacteriia bacterium]|jgi:ATP adenylyltransferase
MERLCTPWRFAYVTGEKKEEGCVFCNRLACDDAEHFVLHRGEHWFMLLNLYPYNSGHILLVLNRHLPKLGECSAEEVSEMGSLLSVMEAALDEAYQPDGINCGYNGGSSAGAGIPEHLHMHMLPRWQGDTNFMSTIGETRVMPQTLPQVYAKLKPLVERIVGERS